MSVINTLIKIEHFKQLEKFFTPAEHGQLTGFQLRHLTTGFLARVDSFGFTDVAEFETRTEQEINECNKPIDDCNRQSKYND